jgi:hypothetical protein
MTGMMGSQGPTAHTMKKKKQIGSYNREGETQINYPKDQNFFHQADLPPKAVQAVGEMKQLTDPDILAMNKQPWVNSNKFEKGEEPHQTNLFAVRHGLKDETIMAPKDPIYYEGTDSRNLYYHGWNVSN